MNYFRFSKVKSIFEELDSYIRRKMRSLLWWQWKRTYTRFKRLVSKGLKESMHGNVPKMEEAPGGMPGPPT